MNDPLVVELDQLHSLNHAIFSDRRLCNHKYSKHVICPLNYRTDIDLEAVKINAVQRLGTFFKEKKPDAVVTHGVATFGMHIIYALCMKHGVPFFNLRHTKIENLTFDEDISEDYNSIIEEMKKALAKTN